jgi:hypothetical protein
MAEKRPDTQRVMGQEEALARAITEMMDVTEQKKKLLSDLSEEECNVLTLLHVIGERLKVKEISRFAEEFCMYRVSRSRMGRREMVNVITFSGLPMSEMKGRKSIKDLFSGIR